MKPNAGDIDPVNVGLPAQLSAVTFDVNEPFQKLPCNLVEWTSDRPGDPKVTGCDVTITFPSEGLRTITAKGTDTQGGSVTRTVTVGPANSPQVTIRLAQGKRPRVHGPGGGAARRQGGRSRGIPTPRCPAGARSASTP